jgi:hypothetical protein
MVGCHRAIKNDSGAILDPTEWQHIIDQIDAAFIFARADFISVHQSFRQLCIIHCKAVAILARAALGPLENQNESGRVLRSPDRPLACDRRKVEPIAGYPHRKVWFSR